MAENLSDEGALSEVRPSLMEVIGSDLSVNRRDLLEVIGSAGKRASLLASMGSLLLAGCSGKKSGGREPVRERRPREEAEVDQQARELDRMRQVILSYLVDPSFTSTDFTQQITGTAAELEMYNLSEGNVYFSVPSRGYDDTVLSKLSNNPSGVEFGELQGRKLALGNYLLSKPGVYFLRFPDDDFRVDKTRQVEIPFKGGIQYVLTVEDLYKFLTNKNIYGGYLNAKVSQEGNEVTTLANHGAFVAKKGEPSLQRLVGQICAGATSPEQQAEKLLNFVRNQIEYSHDEAGAGYETLKRPSEVLMTKSSDCSGKAILMASLLEQTGMDYRLAYMKAPGAGWHIANAVAGNFPKQNGLSFNIGDQGFSIAESAGVGQIRIGVDQICNDERCRKMMNLKDIKFLQRPGEENAKLYGAWDGKPLDFT